MWIAFKHKKPKLGQKIITRSCGYQGKGDSFEDWREWKKEILAYKPSPTHWWHGEYNFDLAVENWLMLKTLEASSS